MLRRTAILLLPLGAFQPDGKRAPLCEREYLQRLNHLLQVQSGIRGSYFMVCSALYFTHLYISYVDFPRQKIPYRAFYVFRLSYCLRPAGLVTKMTTTSIVVSTTPLSLPRNAQGVIAPFSNSLRRPMGIIGMNVALRVLHDQQGE